MLVTKERDKALAQTIKDIGQQEFAGSLSKFVSQLARFDNLIVLVYNGNNNPAVLYREYKDPVVYLHMDSSYLAGAYRLDPFYLEHLKGAEDGVHRLIDVVPSHLHQTNYFASYYQHTTLVDEVAIFADIGEKRTITACFGKDRSSGIAFSCDELKALKGYEQVMSALLASQWQQVSLNTQNECSEISLSDRMRDCFERENGIKLTPRQAEVATYILQGHSSLSISLHLDISTETVKVFRRQLYAKCNISSQAELFALLMPMFNRLRGN